MSKSLFVSHGLFRALALAICFAPSAPVGAQFLLARITPPAPETEAEGTTRQVDVSADGRTLVFATEARNWFPGQLVGDSVIALDLGTGEFESVARNGMGAALNGNTFTPVASGDGRYVAYTTAASNLGLGFATSGSHAVRKDRVTGALQLASANLIGMPASGSASGQARETSISADGRFVAFRSDAANLVGGDGNGADDLFVKDLDSGVIEAVSRDLGGAFTSAGVVYSTSHAISGDGRYVVFQSSADNLVSGVGGGTIRVYLRDRQNGVTELVSRNSAGEPAGSQSDNASISPNGRFVAFRSFASNLGGSGGGLFVRDRVAGTTTPVPRPSLGGSLANGCRENDVSDVGSVIQSCFFPAPSKDQVYLHIPGASGTPFLVSSDVADVPGNDLSGASLAVDASGFSMAFETLATNLIPPDANGVSDVYAFVELGFLNGIFADGFED